MDFNPITATTAQWSAFLCDLNNLTPVRNTNDTDEEFNLNLVSRAFVAVKNADIVLGRRAEIVRRVTKALFQDWQHIDDMLDKKTIFTFGAQHPVRTIRTIVRHDGEDHQSLVLIVLQLWHNLPREENQHLLMLALEELTPIDQAGLEDLYLTRFEQYRELAIAIMLNRCEIDRANELFVEKANEFITQDPHWLTWLVCRGLTPESAKVWLDAKISVKEYGEAHRNIAIERWNKIVQHQAASS